MSTPSGSPKSQVPVIIQLQGDTYITPGNAVDRIGHRKGKGVTWVFRNQTQHPLRVTIQNFKMGGTTTTCPVDSVHFSACTANVDLPPAPGTKTVNARLVGEAGAYTYELFVRNRDTGIGNAIDPELQIDNVRFADYLTNPAFIAAVVAVLAALAWWAWR